MFFTTVSALLASVTWMSATLLLVIHADGLSFDPTVISKHLLSTYAPILIGLLIVIDIWLDTNVIGNRDGFFSKFKNFSWGLVVFTGVALFFGSVLAQFFETYWPGFPHIIVIFALFLLFMLRFLSYVKVGSLRSIRSPETVETR